MYQTLGQVFTNAGVQAPPESFGITVVPDPNDPSKQTRPHQLTGLRNSLEQGSYGLWDDPGTGKSLISYLRTAHGILTGKKVLAVMPPGLSWQYLLKFNEQIKGHGFTGKVMDLGPSGRQYEFTKYNVHGWPDLLVIGYQMFLRCVGDLPRGVYSVFVADEAHALKNPSSRTYKTFRQFTEGGEVLYMTGSPAPTTPEDGYGLISLLTPDAYRSKRAFDRIHLVKVQKGNFRVTVGFRNLDRLSKNLYLKARRVTKEDVLDLKKPNVIPIDVVLDEAHQSKYTQLMEERVLEHGDELINAVQGAAMRRYAMTLCSFPHLITKYKKKSQMLVALDALLESINLAETKIVIFASYVDTVENLGEYLKEYSPALIYGGSDTHANKNKFIEDPSCRVAIINPQAGGAGLDGLQGVAHNLMFFEPVGSPGIMDQCASRLIRSGQEHVVNVYLMRVRRTLYMRAVNSVLMSRVHDYKSTLVSPGDFLEELLGSI